MINKIGTILKAYEKNHAKTWDISTDFYGSWLEMARKLNQFPNSISILPNKVILKKIITDGLREKYKMIIGDKNVTPITTSKEYASAGAIRQYLQEGSALGFLNYSDGDKVNDGSEFSIHPKLWDLQKDPNLLCEIVFLALIKSVSSEIYFEKNLGYSLFLSLVDQYDDTIFDKFPNHILVPRTKKKFTQNFLNEKSTKEFIKHIRGLNTKMYGNGKRTYLQAAKKLIAKYGFEKIVDALHVFIIDPNKLEFINSIDTKNQKLHNELLVIYQKLMKKRLNLRNEILKQRVGDLESYSDLNSSPQNNTHIGLLKACHIYDVWRIKEDIRLFVMKEKTVDGVNEKFLCEADDPNNGILLNSTCHDMFDKGIVWFDTQGFLCFRNEHKSDVIKHFGDNPTTISIKPKSLTPQMKQYLSKRN